MIFFLVIFFISIGTLEFLLIVLDPYLFKGFFQYDRDLGYKVRPYNNHSNQFGFNDGDYPLKKDPKIYRIVILSDSFNWAGGREKNYTAILENMFEKHYGKHKVDIINAGYSGTHTGEQLILLKKYALKYNPDFVFLGFFMGNDFFDADPNRKRIVVNDIQIDIDRRKECVVFGYPIIPKSRLFLFVEQKYKIFKELFKAQKEKKGATFTEETFLKIEAAKLDFFNLEAHKKHIYDQNVNYIFNAIDDMNNLLKSKNIIFMVGIYPDEFQVNDNLLNQIFAKFNLRRDIYDLDLGQKLLKQYLDSKNISYIDMLNQFRIEGKKESLYLLRNTHWNDAGNNLAANIIFQNTLNFVK